LSKHKTFSAHFSLFSGTQFGKHCLRLRQRPYQEIIVRS